MSSAMSPSPQEGTEEGMDVVDLIIEMCSERALQV